jgi:hypothetical protein
MAPRRLLHLIVIAVLCAVAAVAIWVTLTKPIDYGSGRILLTTIAVSFFGLLGVPASVLLEQRRALLLARASAALTVAALILTVVVIWRDYPWGTVGHAWGLVSVLAIAAAEASTVEVRRRADDSPLVTGLTYLTTLTGAALAALALTEILGALRTSDTYRATGALGILNVFLLATAAVLRRGFQPDDRRAATPGPLGL